MHLARDIIKSCDKSLADQYSSRAILKSLEQAEQETATKMAEL